MANYAFTASWLDEDGDTSVMSGHLVAATEAAALTALQTMLTNADGLSLAKLVSVNLVLDVNISAWTLKAAPAADSDVEIGGRFVFTAVGGFRTTLTIPGFDKNTYSAVGGQIPNVAPVSTFVSAVTVNDFSSSHYEDITALLEAYETFNGKR